jgi:replicative DNA helicase
MNLTSLNNDTISTLSSLVHISGKGKYTIIASRPSMGKTWLALSMARHFAEKQHIPVCYFSLELDADAIKKRLQVSELPFFVNDKTNVSIQEICNNIQRLVKEEQINVFFIDYLSLIGGSPSASLTDQSTEISKALKNLAEELSVSIIVLSQLNRKSDVQSPTITDLRRSTEEDADVILFLQAVLLDNNEEIIQLLIAKNSAGMPEKTTLILSS